MNSDLLERAEEAAGFLMDTGEPILCFSHYDCDGIAAAVIMHEMLDRAGKTFEQVFLDELTEERLAEELEGRDQQVVVFTDIGSGQAETVQQLLGDREVVVIDHHEPQQEIDLTAHVNPHLVGIDGGEVISGAGVTYLVARAMDNENRDLVPYALIGATGDIQTDGDDYLGLNEELMQEALEHDMVEVKKGLKLFGRQGKSIVKALQYTTDPFLEGITDNPSGAIQFLKDVGIDLKGEDGSWRSLADLSEEEERRLVHGLITRGYGDIEKLLGDVYLLRNGWEIREFASLLNACGRLERPEDGLKICLEDDKELAFRLKREYGKRIADYLSYVEEDDGENGATVDMEYGTLIDGDRRIHPNMIGTVATICIKSDIVEGPVVVGLAEKEEDFYKVSGRVKDDMVDEGFALNEVMEEACQEVGGEGGGHSAAAGGKIPKAERERFIKVIGESLKESVAGEEGGDTEGDVITYG
ncbi:MAG: DHH family phosphoesterase [Candidatus Nanohaloarchaea archaeon]|nr:DHH family phosphoesterase [Candidatus Nanohaloarchaea archaeon]